MQVLFAQCNSYIIVNRNYIKNLKYSFVHACNKVILNDIFQIHQR